MRNYTTLKWLGILSVLTIAFFVKVSPDKGFIVPYGFLFIGILSGDVGGIENTIWREFIFYLLPFLALSSWFWTGRRAWIIPIGVSLAYLLNNLNSPQLHWNFLSLIPFWLIWQYLLRRVHRLSD